MKNILLPILGVLILGGCSKGEDVADNTLVFSAGVGATKAPVESNASGLVTNGAVSGIQILRIDGATPAFNTITSVTTTATLATNGVLTPAAVQKVSTDGTQANLMAYYPAGTLTAGQVVWTIDGTNDILVSSVASKSFSLVAFDNKVNFNFVHALARVKLTVKAESQAAINYFGDVVSAKMTVPNKIKMNITANGAASISQISQAAVDADWSRIDFGAAKTALTIQTAENQLMIYADAATIKNASLNIEFAHVAAKDYTITGLALAAGKVTTIELTLKDDGSVILAGNAGTLQGDNGMESGGGAGGLDAGGVIE